MGCSLFANYKHPRELEHARCPGPPAADRFVAQGPQSGAAAFHAASPPSREATSIGVTGMVHIATSLRAVLGDTPAERLALPSPSPAPHGALSAVARRRSERRFL